MVGVGVLVGKATAKSKPRRVGGPGTALAADAAWPGGPEAGAAAPRGAWLVPGAWSALACAGAGQGLRAALAQLPQALCVREQCAVLDVWGRAPPAWLQAPGARRRWPSLWWLRGRGPLHAAELLARWTELGGVRAVVVLEADALAFAEAPGRPPALLQLCRRRGVAVLGLVVNAVCDRRAAAGARAGRFVAWASVRARLSPADGDDRFTRAQPGPTWRKLARKQKWP